MQHKFVFYVVIYLVVCVCDGQLLVLYANFVKVYMLLQPILIRFSLVSFMDVYNDYSSVHCLHQPGCLTVNGAMSQ